jgi:4-diphosphocytidyl-2C-methyl-D-erythritol kinase
MPTSSSLINISVTWRGKKFVVDMNLDATVKDLGEELQKLTDIKEDTMKLIVPQIAGKTSKLLAPFSTEHALLSLRETSITEVRSFT